jgi:cytochrome c-type biogenesis protein CcmH
MPGGTKCRFTNTSTFGFGRALRFCCANYAGNQAATKGAGWVMIGFWISAAAMVMMVAVVLVQAIRQAGRVAPGPVSSRAEDMAIYRDQLAEVDRDLARGVIAPQEADRLRIEVQRRLLEADRAAPVAPVARPVGLPLAAGVVALALVGAAVLYMSLGAPGYPDLPISERLALADADYRARPHQDVAEAKAPPFTPAPDVDKTTLDLIARLRAAVTARPDDLQGQGLLAQNEAGLGNFAVARKAQEAVVRLKGDAATAQDYTVLAELQIYAAGGLVTPEAEASLMAALKRDPKDAASRFYLGLMAAQVGRPDKTFAMWRPLLDESAPDASYLATIRARLQDVADAAGIPYQAPAAADGKGPTAGEMANAAQMSPEDRQKMIEGMVGGLETRLMADGGPVEDWTKLINALGVLKATDRAKAAYAKAEVDFAGKPGELSALKAAAVQAGVAP